MPVSGKIIRGYAKGKNQGIDIAAAAGHRRQGRRRWQRGRRRPRTPPAPRSW
jgi:hypothetical protein